MRPQKFSKGEAIGFGWNTMKTNLGFFIVLLILAGLVYLIPQIISGLTEKSAPLVSFTFSPVISMLLNCVISIGFIRISLKFCDNQKAKFSDLFSCRFLFLKYLGGTILYNLIIFGGFILLIIPGIIWSIKYEFFAYFIVDKGLGPIEALKRSAAITRGTKWDLFVFGILLVGINMLGVLALFIGLFATIPISMIAMAFIYRKLLSQTESTTPPKRDVFASNRGTFLELIGRVSPRKGVT